MISVTHPWGRADTKGHLVVLQLVPIVDPADKKKSVKYKPVVFKKGNAQTIVHC